MRDGREKQFEILTCKPKPKCLSHLASFPALYKYLSSCQWKQVMKQRKKVSFLGSKTRIDQADGKMVQVSSAGVIFSQSRDALVKYFE